MIFVGGGGVLRCSRGFRKNADKVAILAAQGGGVDAQSPNLQPLSPAFQSKKSLQGRITSKQQV